MCVYVYMFIYTCIYKFYDMFLHDQNDTKFFIFTCFSYSSGWVAGNNRLQQFFPWTLLALWQAGLG